MTHGFVAGPVVLCAIDLTVVQGGIHLAVHYLYRLCAEVGDHFAHHVRFLHADGQALQICKACHLLPGVDAAHTGIKPGKARQLQRLQRGEELVADGPIQHAPHLVSVGVKVRQLQNAQRRLVLCQLAEGHAGARARVPLFPLRRARRTGTADKITPTPGETQIDVFDEITPTPTIEITPTPEDPGFEIKNEQSQIFENDNFGNQNSYNPSQENGSWDQSADGNQDGSWDQSADGNQDGSWEQSNEVNQNPESGENGEYNESQVAPEEVLRNYAQTLTGQKAGFSGTSVPYTDSNSVNTALNGIVGIQEEDINKDGIPELLVISMQYGRMSFTVYKVNNGTIEIGTTITAICDGTGTALGDVSYGCTQDCFIKDNADSYIVGFASYVYGVDAGDGTTAARTNFEAYKIGTDGNAELLTATTIQNGLFVYSGGDATNAQAGGQDMFAGAVGAAGFSGNWNAANASALDGMDLINNPYQDMCGAPDPLSGGLAAQEGGVQDLAIVNGTMGAGTGTLSFDLQDYTTFTN